MDEFYPAFANRGFLNRGESPLSRGAGPVRARQPLFPLVRVPSLCPIPQVAVDLPVQCSEGLARSYVPVIVGPAPDYRVQGADHIAGFPCRELPDCFLDSGQDSSVVTPGRSREELPVVFARALPQEIKSVLYSRDPGFLRRKGKPSWLEKLFYCRLDRLFKKFFRFPGDDEVVGVADYVDFGAVGGDGFYRCLQSVQGHIGQDWGDNPPLRGPRLGRVEVAFFNITCLQPLPKHEAIHWDVFHEPVMADSVETGFDIPFKYPLRRAPLCQPDVALVYGIGATSVQTKPV